MCKIMDDRLSQLGPLAQLPGRWRGHGFGTIWRPHYPANPQSRFLELNLTTEVLAVTRINGPIPNRGLLAPDIFMFGLTYVHQVSETSTGVGIHLETGMWMNVPATTAPAMPPSVVRMASIARGTSMLAQGTAQGVAEGVLHIPDNNIIPVPIGSDAPAQSDFAAAEKRFPELNLSVPTPFRKASPGVTSAMVQNPNSVLQRARESLSSQTFIHVSTAENPVLGGSGTANAAFLAGRVDPPGGNGKIAQIDMSLWIGTARGPSGRPEVLQLQYSQIAQVEFDGLRWPHCSVGTLLKE